MNQIEKVMQQNTANAEQSASAGEELSAQAEELTHMAAILMGIVGGNGRDMTMRGFRGLTGDRKPARLIEAAGSSGSLAGRRLLHSLPLKTKETTETQRKLLMSGTEGKDIYD
ncbi:MAG: hypothetical protein AB1611_06205 [bacterium]